MKIKKTHAALAAALLLLAVTAYIGHSIWYSTILPAVGNAANLPLLVIAGIAFGGGLATFFTPCGLAVLPAFLSYNMAAVGGDNVETRELTKYLAKLGVFGALGMLTFFGLLGAGFQVLGSTVNAYVTPLKYVVALLFVVFGVLLYRNTTIVSSLYSDLQEAVHDQAMQHTGYKAYYLFGFAYGLDAIGCLFPLVFALMILPLLAGKLAASLIGFGMYSLGVATMLTIFAYGVARGKKNITDSVEYADTIRRWTGAGLVLGGVLLIIYYAFWGMTITT